MRKSLLSVTMFFTLVMILITPALNKQIAIGGEPELIRGETVYVPVYSHILFGDRKIPLKLSVNLSGRNTDPDHSITILAVDYFNSEGVLVKNYLEKSDKLNPLGSTFFHVGTSDMSGGRGANFIVNWEAEAPVNIPIIESLMSGSLGTHAFSYVSRGQAIKRAPR